MEENVRKMLEELDENQRLWNRYRIEESKIHQVREKYVKTIKEEKGWKYIDGIYTGSISDNLEIKQPSDIIYEQEEDFQGVCKTISIILALVIGGYIFFAFNVPTLIAIILGVISACIFGAIVFGISKIIQLIYFALPGTKQKIEETNKRNKDKWLEVNNNLKNEYYTFMKPHYKKLDEINSQYTIPNRYFSYIQRMKDYIETGKAKSIKEAILILDEYIQREQLIESNRQTTEAIKDAGW
jgi:hypothetical protein